MYRLILLFFDITILRKGPQDVPASQLLLTLVLLADLVISILAALLTEDVMMAVSQIIVALIVIASFCWPLLYFADKTARFTQTLCALLGADIIISCVEFPVFALQNSLLMLLLLLWHWIVYGHIFRHALDRPLFFGLGLAFLYQLLSIQIVSLLFPVAAISS